MQVTPGTPSIQLLKAQQALEARRASQAARPQPEPADLAPTPSLRTAARPARVAEPTAPSETAPPIAPNWARKVQDIQHVAAKAGFLDVSEQDIRRAYTHGESLLADYRV